MTKPNLKQKEKEWKRIQANLKEKQGKKSKPLNDGQGSDKDREEKARWE